MKSIFRATALLSGSSATSIAVSLVSTKVLASILRPAGYGYYGLLQSFVAVASVVVGLGMASGIVRLGAGPAERNDHAAVARVRAGAWLLAVALGAATMAVLAWFRNPLSRWALGSEEHSGALLLMGIAIWFTVALNVQNGILNAWHRVQSLAAYGVANSLLSAAVAIVAVSLWGARGTVPAVIGSAIAGWVASRWFLWRDLERVPVRVPVREALKAARELLAFGLPFTASCTVGNGVQLALPILVLHLLNTESVAYYKAAATISVSYLGFLVTAMGQDYYPRLSAVRHDPARMIALIHEQYRLMMLLAAPIVLATIALVPYIVPLVYSQRFLPAARILEWQLIGDLLRFSSWTMSYAILARAKPIVYFCTESIGGLLTLATAWLGVRWFGLAGLGIGFVITYAGYYLAVRMILRREIPVRETAGNLRLIGVALAAALTIRILPSTSLAAWRTTIALALAAAFALFSFLMLRREYFASRTRRAVLIAG
jgi:antigen flippase